MGSKSTQKTIKVDEGLWNELDKWLKTYSSKRLGYHSKAQFATEAIRELLVKVEYDKQIHVPAKSVKIIKEELIKNKEEMETVGVFTVKDFIEYAIDRMTEPEKEIKKIHQKIKKLSNQKDEEMITEDEFIIKRKKIVNDELERLDKLERIDKEK